jgi:GNAT superfamily N-acetyltransferase
MMNSKSFHIAQVMPEELHALRRGVLRGGDDDARVDDARDHDAAALHLAGIDEGVVVVSSSFYPSTSPVTANASSYQLRYLATAFTHQRRGLAARVMVVAEALLRERGCEEIWANGRDAALDFYRATGWTCVAGSEHLSPETQLPHTVIFRPLP